jgi:hypothetical protein
MNIIKLCKVIVLLAFCFNTQAAWSTKELHHMKAFKPNFKNPYLGTVKSLCEKGKYKKSLIKGQYSKYTVSLPSYMEEDLVFNLVLQEKNGEPIKAPFILAIPGAFTNLDDDQSIMWMQYYSNLGYHVMTLPNPWGTDFISKKTKFKMGDYVKEAQTLYEAFKSTYAHLQKKNLVSSTTHLFGMSYGAFMTAIINSFAARDGFFFSKATMVSPPIDLKITINLLDEQIEEIKHLGVSGSLLGTLVNFKKVCKIESEEQADSKLLAWSKYLAVEEGFHVEIVNSVKEFDDTHDLDLVPGAFSGDRADWKKEMNFSKYFEDYAPELKALLNSEKSAISYWNKRAKAYGAKNLRIMASDDDFINVKFRKAKDDGLVFLRGGGHFGFRNSKWFDQFISIAF